MKISTRAKSSALSALSAVVCLIIMWFFFLGTEYFFDINLTIFITMLSISAIAGLVRLAIARGGYLLSAVLGILVSITCFTVIMFYAMKSI